jgi:iron(III) transport system ATP-binding protein
VGYVTHDQEEALAVSDKIIVMSNARIAQVGTPFQLYEEPANLFVADFIGDANVIDAELVSASGSDGLVRVGSTELTLPRRGTSPGKVKLAIRPDAMRLSDNVVAGGLRGTVKKVSYLGRVHEYTIATPIGELFMVEPGRSPARSKGSEVTIDFGNSGIVMLPPV